MSMGYQLSCQTFAKVFPGVPLRHSRFFPVRPYSKLLAQRANSGDGLKRIVCQAAGVGTAKPSIDVANLHASGEGSDEFSWTNNWYPVGVPETLDKTRPHSVTLLGMDLVLWCDGQGAWQCFEDKCPHRLAPLSEGRIESDGSLLCAYHGWRFNSEGQCTAIPQARKEVEGKLKSDPRACAVKYPLQETWGLLWVWPDSRPESFIHSAAVSPPLPKEAKESSDVVAVGPWYVRDMPYGYEVLLENFTDPAHLPVSHHTKDSGANRYAEDQVLIPEPIEKDDDPAQVFKFRYKFPYFSHLAYNTMIFTPPSLIKVDSVYANGAVICLVLYGVPIVPGKSMLFSRSVEVKGKDGVWSFGLAKKTLTPAWLKHVRASRFFHQDQVFLYQQERIARRQGKRWTENYHMPTAADRILNTFHQWLKSKAGGGPAYAPGTPLEVEPIDRDFDKQFDVYQAHTKKCAECQKGLRLVYLLRNVLVGLAVACVVQGAVLEASKMGAVGVPALSGPLASIPVLGLLYMTATSVNVAAAACWLAALLLVAGAVWMHKLSEMFYVVRFSHPDNN